LSLHQLNHDVYDLDMQFLGTIGEVAAGVHTDTSAAASNSEPA
jgi:hypothetical protein